MAVTVHFSPPSNFNLYQYELGQAVTGDSELIIVASGTDIGTFPVWINEIEWSGDPNFYYSVRFMTDDEYWTAWSTRTHGRYGGAGFEYFIHYPSGDTVYLVPQPASGTADVQAWLSYNTEYTITVTSEGLYGENTDEMEADYSFTFTAEYCPIFSTVDSVRMHVGPLADSIPDDTVNRMIQKASWDLITRYFNEINPYGCDYTSVPEPVYRWVTCASAMQLMNAALAAGGGPSNTTKRLGQLSITYDGVAAELPGDIRKNLQDCMREAGVVISAANGTLIMSAVKSLSNTKLLHPMSDVAWGRMPRKVENNGLIGPWSPATRDHQTYDDTSSTISEDGAISGTYFL